MRNITKNFGIAFGIFALIIFIGTCTFNKNENPPPPPPDNSYIKVLKEQQTELETQYKKHISVLEKTSDSLLTLVAKHKTALSLYRFKSNLLEQRLKEALAVYSGTEAMRFLTPRLQ